MKEISPVNHTNYSRETKSWKENPQGASVRIPFRYTPLIKIQKKDSQFPLESFM